VLSQELNHLKANGRLEDIQTIQSLSSQKAELTDEVRKLDKQNQEQSETIVSLNEQIETMSRSDSAYMKNKALEVKLSKQENRLKREQARIEEDKKSSSELVREAENKLYNANRIYSDNCELWNNSRARINEESERLFRAKFRNLISIIASSFILYAVVIVFKICGLKRPVSDLRDFLHGTWYFICSVWKWGMWGYDHAWSLHEIIPYKLVNVIIPGMLAIIAFVVIAVGIYTVIGYIIYIVGLFYYKEFFDVYSLDVLVISIFLLTWFADNMTFIKLNLVVVFFMIQGIYLLTRMISRFSGRGYW
jgi:hypothetical protein